ncbi:cation:proton antiporter [Ekhidna sp.]|uniref:cation:proton antiporter domain-containing protein n=1 Tax=Ekhidna sp. TaxID=2608089 RepID=UPI0032EFDAA1
MSEFFSEHINTLLLLLGFWIVSISANQIAKLFQQIKLPLITGLIFSGILVGPYIIGLIPTSAETDLRFINEISLAYIAFAAGAELYLIELRSKLRTIKIHSIVQSVVGMILGTFFVFMIIDLMPFANGLELEAQVVVSMLISVLFIAPSPASVIAVISELRAKGPFTKTMLGVTMAKDFFVVVLFAIVLSISKSLLSTDKIQVLDFVFLALEIITSFGLAYVVGKLLHAIMKWGERKYIKTVLILVLGLLNYTFSNFFREFSSNTFGHEVYFEPLLICLIASFYIANYTKYRAEFLKILNDISLYVYVAFFTLTGASMNLSVLSEVWVLALLLFVVRLITVILGSFSGSALNKDKAKYYQVGWMPYVAQAGVALGLVTVVANQFPEWGGDFATLCISVIIINQLVGPPLIAKAITIMGENKKRAATPIYDGVKDALIFGSSNQSLALANQLVSKGWIVEIATQEADIFSPDENIRILNYNKISNDFFEEVQASKYDAIVSMLTDEESLEICRLVYEEVGTRDIIVQINNPTNLEAFKNYDARIVDPSSAMISLLDHFVRSPQATSLILGMEKGKDSRDIVLRNNDLHGITLRELRLPSDVIILSVMRSSNVIITHGYTRLRLGDTLTLVGSDQSLDEVQQKFS